MCYIFFLPRVYNAPLGRALVVLLLFGLILKYRKSKLAKGSYELII